MTNQKAPTRKSDICVLYPDCFNNFSFYCVSKCILYIDFIFIIEVSELLLQFYQFVDIHTTKKCPKGCRVLVNNICSRMECLIIDIA